MISYQAATWRIQIGPSTFVDIQVMGQETDRTTTSPALLKQTGRVVMLLAQAIARIQRQIAPKGLEPKA